MAHILQCLWFNVNADNLCLKLLKLISDANSHFKLSSQQVWFFILYYLKF